MRDNKTAWLEKYPQAWCWSFGDSPELANELAALVVAGKKPVPVARLPAIKMKNRA